MKSVLALGILLIGGQAVAAPSPSLEAVECKREMMATALAKYVERSSLWDLGSSNYSVSDFYEAPASSGSTDIEYLVTVEISNRVTGYVGHSSYQAKVLDFAKCIVQVSPK
ncbi:MAG: hypothetical protein J0L82_14415 [Deltaproteobacteria bacterium]|jgi:hypothetical protein|nr:hypothetical protein [Deltaproteobacteria bacterium]